METFQMGNAAYGDQALCRSNVFWWYVWFRDGREDIEDEPRSDRPTECRNDNNVEHISQLLLQNRLLFAKNASRRDEHWQGHSVKDCSWRFAKMEDLFALCFTLFDSRAERPEKCSLPRFDCHSRQCSFVFRYFHRPAYVNQSKSLLIRENYHVIVTNNINVNRTAGRLESKTVK